LVLPDFLRLFLGLFLQRLIGNLLETDHLSKYCYAFSVATGVFHSIYQNNFPAPSSAFIAIDEEAKIPFVNIRRSWPPESRHGLNGQAHYAANAFKDFSMGASRLMRSRSNYAFHGTGFIYISLLFCCGS
jgi:hypothetical protein